ncbi:FtsX-like permease family protein [Kitasatospora sp. NPDC092948]|uniref:FtsX-like permease family protein n=1 Tax=Kitasatospora sp. NPDC092948 TaxID=3364088 RepID=UPI0037F55284
MRAKLYPLLLGVRLVRGYGRSGWARVGLMAGGTGLGVVVLLLAIAVPGMLQHRLARADARTVVCAAADGRPAAGCGLPGQTVSDSWYGKPVQRQLVGAGLAVAPPPGLAALPAPGEVVLSPALRALYDEPDNQALRDRLPGRVVGTIADQGLMQPDELLAYVGVPGTPGAFVQVPDGYGPQARNVTGPAVVTGAGDVSDSRKNAITLIVGVIAVLTPVLLFLASCARLSAATRDRRLAALRLLGVTPRQAQVVNAGESAVVASLGALLGLAAFEALVPFTEGWTVAGYGWFTADLQPPWWQTTLLLVAVPVLAVAVGAIAVRRTTASLTAARADAVPKPPSFWRLAPLLLGAAISGYAALSSPPGRTDPNTSMLFTMAAGLLLVFVGLAAGTPLIARQVGALLGRTARSVAVLLGARRLESEAAGAARVVSGLVLLVFAGTFGQSVFAAVQDRTAAGSWRELMASGVYQGPARTSAGAPVDAEVFAHVPGVRAVVPVRRLQTPTDFQQVGAGQAGAGEIATAGGPPAVGGMPNKFHSAVALTCAELSAVVKKAPAGCAEGTPYWFAGPARPAVPADSGTPITLVPSSAQDQPVQVTAPTAALALPDPNAVSGGSPVAADLMIPPTTPGLAADARTATSYLIATDGAPATLEALDAAAARVDPSLTVGVPDIALEAQYQFPLFRALLTLGTLLVLGISCAAVTVGSIDRAVERRREVALQAVVGVPLPTMRLAQLFQVLIPYGSGIALALGLALVTGRAYARTGGTSGGIPLTGVAQVAGIALFGATVAGLCALPALGGRIRAEFLHRE